MRRLLRAARKGGVPAELVGAAERTVDDFAVLVRREAGDRSALEAMIAGWLPEARSEFELRRKQTAFRAISELHGAAASTHVSTVLLHPSGTPERLDVVWIFGLLGFRRLRPGVAAKFASRRFGRDEPPRHPQTLDGKTVEGYDGLLLEEFCSSPMPQLDALRHDEMMRYQLRENGFGPRSAVDIICAEVNPNEMVHYVPDTQRRKRHVFTSVATPVKTLILDALLHESVFPEREPSLAIYDTAIDGVADINNPARDIDRMDLHESIQHLGRGLSKYRAKEIPRYADLLRYTCRKLGWDGDAFRCYRCRIDYPLYGTQIVFAWDSVPPPNP